MTFSNVGFGFVGGIFSGFLATLAGRWIYITIIFVIEIITILISFFRAIRSDENFDYSTKSRLKMEKIKKNIHDIKKKLNISKSPVQSIAIPMPPYTQHAIGGVGAIYGGPSDSDNNDNVLKED